MRAVGYVTVNVVVEIYESIGLPCGSGRLHVGQRMEWIVWEGVFGVDCKVACRQCKM